MSTTIQEAPGLLLPDVPGRRSRATLTKFLLASGILSSLLYVAMNIVGALRFEGYSSVSQTVSELSAIGAPSRPLWVPLAIAYGVLLIAFGLGVWASAGEKRALRVVGGVLIAYAAIGFAWPPMHLRGEGTSLTDTMHIAFTAVAVPLMLVIMGVGAGAFGKRFRIYSIVSLVILLGFGALTGLYGPRIPKDLPTPWVGVWERISIAAFMVWVIVLAIALLRAQGTARKATWVREGEVANFVREGRKRIRTKASGH
jgi:hypothetical protein